MEEPQETLEQTRQRMVAAIMARSDSQLMTRNYVRALVGSVATRGTVEVTAPYRLRIQIPTMFHRAMQEAAESYIPLGWKVEIQDLPDAYAALENVVFMTDDPIL